MNYYLYSPNPISLFDQARQHGRFQKLKCLILRCSQSLLDLEEVVRQSTYSQHYEGIRPASINTIGGTQGRRGDFDGYFHPLSDRAREPWVSVAQARQNSVPLELVRLIRVNNRNFVVDGHNRISVARTFGESVVDAEAVVWEIREELKSTMGKEPASQQLMNSTCDVTATCPD